MSELIEPGKTRGERGKEEKIGKTKKCLCSLKVARQSGDGAPLLLCNFCWLSSPSWLSLITFIPPFSFLSDIPSICAPSHLFTSRFIYVNMLCMVVFLVAYASQSYISARRELLLEYIEQDNTTTRPAFTHYNVFCFSNTEASWNSACA